MPVLSAIRPFRLFTAKSTATRFLRKGKTGGGVLSVRYCLPRSINLTEQPARIYIQNFRECFQLNIRHRALLSLKQG